MSSKVFKHRVTNIVGKATLPFKPDILTLVICDVCDFRTRFPGGKKRMKHSTCIVFESGVVLTLGAKRANEAKWDMQDFVTQICTALFKPTCTPECVIVNSVGTFSFPKSVQLVLFSCFLEANDYKTFYEPELNSRLQIKIDGATILLHHSGKGIIAKGYTDECYMSDVLTKLWKLHQDFEV